MRKTLIVFILSFVSTVCFAKPKSVEPDWFKNYRTVFPNAQYLAQRGSGTTIVSIKSSEGKAVFSYEAKMMEKTVAYSLENAQKKAFSKLAEKINEEIKF